MHASFVTDEYGSGYVFVSSPVVFFELCGSTGASDVKLGLLQWSIADNMQRQITQQNSYFRSNNAEQISYEQITHVYALEKRRTKVTM